MKLIHTLRAFALAASFWQLANLTATAACTTMLPADAVAWWKLDQSTDEVISGLPGTLMGEASFVAGHTGGGLSLDGSGDLLSVPNSASLQLQNFTIEAWIKRASLTGTSMDNPPSGAIFGGGAGSYVFALGTDGLLVLGHVGIGTALGSVAITDLEWHHVAVAKDGQNVGFYVDGAPAGVANYAQSYTFNTPFGVGALGAPFVTDQVGRWYGFWGQIDEVTVYSRPLTAAEIQAVFAAGESGKCTEDVSLSLVSAPLEGNVGKPAQVEIAVRNLNLVEVSGVVVSTEISGPAALIGGTPSQGGCSVANGVVTCDLGALPAGGGAVITLQLTPTAAGECHLLSSLGPIVGNANPLNDQVEKTLEVLGGCTPTPAGLVAWWRGENDGHDLLGTKNGTFTSGPPEFTTGRVGQAFLFDGKSGYRVADSPDLHLQEFTIEAWVKRASLSASSLSTPPAGVIFGGSAGGYSLSIGADGTLFLSHLGLNNINGTGRITDLNWHHVALTRAGTQVRFFLDAQDAGITSYAGTFTFDGAFGLGVAGQFFGGFNYAFLGAVDEVSLYSRALTPEEIKAVQLSRSAGKCYEDISVLADSASQATLGGETTYDLRVDNHGTVPATGVVVTHPMPVGATFVSATTAAGSVALSDGAVRWEIGTVAPDSSATLAVKVRLAQQGFIAFAAGVTRAEPDLSSENNTVHFNIEVVGPCVSPPSGLVAWLAGEGNFTDELEAHPGTPAGVSIVPGHTGQGFLFDGTGEIAIANDPVFQGPSFSIEVWVHPTKLDGREDMIVTHESLWWQPQRFLLSIRGQSYPELGTIPYANLAFLLGGLAGVPNDDAGWIDGHGQVAVGKWSHVALTYGDGVARAYINGVLTREITGLTGALANSDGPIRLGSRRPEQVGQDGVDRFNGRLDEFSYYAGVLSPAEIAAINTSGSAGKCHGPVPVTIISQPADQTVFVGANVSFAVGAAGSPTLTYRWRSNNVEIAGATTATLSLPAVTKAATAKYGVTVCNPTGCAPEVEANLTVRPPPALVQFLSVTGKSPDPVSVPVVITANGDENAVSFSVGFSQWKFSFEGATLGVGAGAAQLLVNASAIAAGSLGVAVALPAGQTFPEGSGELVRLTFRPVLSATPLSSLFNFADHPIPRQLADAGAKTLPVTWGDFVTLTIAAADFEADVFPRPDGEKLVSVSDWVQVGRFVAALDDLPPGPEYQRADCAPFETRGNGVLTVSDWVEAGRLAAGLDAYTPAGGPTGPPAPDEPATAPVLHGPKARAVHLAGVNWCSGCTNDVFVVLESAGDENALAFSLTFDAAKMTFVEAIAADDAQNAAFNFNLRELAKGRVGLALALNAGSRFEAGARKLARLRFRANSSAGSNATLAFSDLPVLREVASPVAVALASSWLDGTILVGPPALSVARKETAAGAQLELSWPAQFETAVLETADGLANTTWTPVPDAPQLRGETRTVSVPLGINSSFFRLRIL
jgi:uncharacterized repeat protein (TIGR01451 family)